MAYSDQSTNQGTRERRRETTSTGGGDMYKIILRCLVVVALLASGAGAQGPAESVAAATAEYKAWIDVLADFTQGIEIDEEDIQQFLRYWPEMNDLAVMAEEDESDSASEFSLDVREVLADPEYRSWASNSGLDPEDWLRKSTRVSTLMLARQMEAQGELVASQRQSYAAMVEESCAQVDEDTCREMRAGMEHSMAMSEAMMKATAKLPPASADETALLERYQSELESMVMAGDEDEYYSDYEDYDEDYDDDYDDDDG